MCSDAESSDIQINVVIRGHTNVNLIRKGHKNVGLVGKVTKKWIKTHKNLISYKCGKEKVTLHQHVSGKVGVFQKM